MPFLHGRATSRNGFALCISLSFSSGLTRLLVKLSAADYAMRDFVKVSGRLSDEGKVAHAANGHPSDESD